MSQKKSEQPVEEDKVKFSETATKAAGEAEAEINEEKKVAVIDPEFLEPEVLEPEIVSDEEESSDESLNKDPRTKVLMTLKEDLKKKNEEATTLRQEFVKLQAETENCKKRMTKEKSDFAQFANEKLIKELVPIYENLERALNADDASAENLKTGVDMILKSFTAFLEKEKVTPIASVGEKFDPKVHEALSQIESEDEEENVVLQEFSKGFYLNGRVLRPASVVISKKPQVSQKEDAPKETEGTK